MARRRCPELAAPFPAGTPARDRKLNRGAGRDETRLEGASNAAEGSLKVVPADLRAGLHRLLQELSRFGRWTLDRPGPHNRETNDADHYQLTHAVSLPARRLAGQNGCCEGSWLSARQKGPGQPGTPAGLRKKQTVCRRIATANGWRAVLFAAPIPPAASIMIGVADRSWVRSCVDRRTAEPLAYKMRRARAVESVRSSGLIPFLSACCQKATSFCPAVFEKWLGFGLAVLDAW